MTTRRSFLTALGTGLVGLGLPGVAGAWGRRRWRRCMPAPCVPMPCPPVDYCSTSLVGQSAATVTGPAQCLCAQSETPVGDMWYITGEVCPSSPVQYQSFTWSTQLQLCTGCPGTCDPQHCVEYKIGTQPRSGRFRPLHYIPDRAMLRQTTLDMRQPPAIANTANGQAMVIDWHDCTLRYKGQDVPVRLMLLGLGLNPATPLDQQGMVIAPVGQQAHTATANLPDLSGSAHPVHGRSDYFIVTLNHCDYHVLMVP